MAQTAQASTRPALEVVRAAAVSQAASGILYATAGETSVPASDLERMVGAVPRAVASALDRKAFYFVPLVVSDGDETLVAERYDVALSDRAVCHRNLAQGDAQCVFISTRLMDDRFSLAFEFYINVGHAFVERAGVAQAFSDVVWRQAQQNVRGESSLDAHELRKIATGTGPDAPKARGEYFEAAFSDAVAIYLLSLYLDVDYHELRERDYPLLAPAALAERIRVTAELFPPNPGFEFAIYHRRRG